MKMEEHNKRCVPLLRRLSQTLIQGDCYTADEVKEELHECMPEFELLAHFWRMLEAAAMLVRGLWLQDAALSFQTGVLLGKLGHGALARQIYMRTHTQLLGTPSEFYEQGGAQGHLTLYLRASVVLQSYERTSLWMKP